MKDQLNRYSWLFVLQGVLAIALGVATFVAPQPTLAAFIAVFAAYAVVSGALSIGAGLSLPTGPSWALVLGGIAGIAVGVLTFIQPDATAVAVVLLVGIYAIATGVAQVGAAFTLGGFTNTWLLGLSGVVSVAFGVLLVMAPTDGVLAVLWLIGIYIIYFGIMSVAAGLGLHRIGKDVSSLVEQAPAPTGTAGTTAGSSAARS
jgi:uncharacterized membrane protein HdeD (DUF308 family)